MVSEHGGLKRDLVVGIIDAEEPPFFQTKFMGSNRFYDNKTLDKRIRASREICDYHCVKGVSDSRTLYPESGNRSRRRGIGVNER